MTLGLLYNHYVSQFTHNQERPLYRRLLWISEKSLNNFFKIVFKKQLVKKNNLTRILRELTKSKWPIGLMYVTF